MNRTLKFIVFVVVLAAVAETIWLWGFCRFYVGPNEMAVITAKNGDPLEPGQILARDGQRGIRETPLGEGRHFLNPFFYQWDIVPVTLVQPGKVAVVTSKVGATLAEGEFLAARGEKGIWRGVLGPGKYRLNPHGYQVEIVDASLVEADTRRYRPAARELVRIRESAVALGGDEGVTLVDEHLADLRERYARRPSLLAALDRAGLP